MALVTNKGFRDILLIGNQARPSIFQLVSSLSATSANLLPFSSQQNIQRPEVLYSEVVEVDCRAIPALPGKCELGERAKGWRLVEGETGEKLYVTREVDAEEVEGRLKKIKDEGVDSVAVALAHSYMFAAHEVQIGAIAKKIGS